MMKKDLMLDQIPDPETFYKKYWGKQAFIVKGAIDRSHFEDLIPGDELAGLSLEEEVQSRIVRTARDGKSWSCANGPFEENIFEELGENNWTLLVQNCDRFHPPTANLLKQFNFSPRWLLDDIMTSFSAPGGSVGPHIDSYHVFLVQGQGKRKWKVGFDAILNEEYIENIDLKVLKHDFEGQEIDATCGDLIYIPPFVPHEGVTIEPALTYSVGFLGPSISELLIEYGHFLANRDQNQQRYTSAHLTADSQHFNLGSDTIKDIQKTLIESIKSDDFYTWLAGFFSSPQIEEEQENPDILNTEQLSEFLNKGGTLYRPEEIKMTLTQMQEGWLNVGIEGHIFQIEKEKAALLENIIQGGIICKNTLNALDTSNEAIEILCQLYNAHYLHAFNSDD